MRNKSQNSALKDPFLPFQGISNAEYIHQVRLQLHDRRPSHRPTQPPSISLQFPPPPPPQHHHHFLMHITFDASIY